VFAFAPTSPPGFGAGVQIDDVLVAHHHGIPGGTFTMRSGIDLNTDAPPDLGSKWLIGVGTDALSGGTNGALLFANYLAANQVGEGVALYYLGAPTGYMLSPPAAGSLLGYYLGSNSDSRLRWTGIYGHAIDALSGFTERGRPVPMGEWQQMPYNPANFTGSGGMVVTVDAGDQVNYSYTLIGKTMILSLYIAPFSVSGGGTHVQIAIPNGLLGAAFASSPVSTLYDNGALGSGVFSTQTGSPWVFVERTGGAAWTASVNNSYIIGQFIFPIQ
jgi:hypothetical protein